MRIAHALLVVCLASVASCAHSPNYDYASVATSTLVCEINTNPSAYVGKTVVLEGIYKSDGSLYSYLSDKRCKHNGLISLGNDAPDRDSTVDAFNSARLDTCLKRNRPYLCTVSTHMVAEVTIGMGQTGHLVYGDTQLPLARLRKVVFYRFFGD